MPAAAQLKVVVFVQENHTIDCYFSALAPWGANVATGWPAGANPPASDQSHDRHAYFRWLQGKQGGRKYGKHVPYDTDSLLPFYSYLAKTGTFFENHGAGLGTNSTPNQQMIVGGQATTLRNPPHGTNPVWDIPSLPALAKQHDLEGLYRQRRLPTAFLEGSPGQREHRQLRHLHQRCHGRRPARPEHGLARFTL